MSTDQKFRNPSKPQCLASFWVCAFRQDDSRRRKINIPAIDNIHQHKQSSCAMDSAFYDLLDCNQGLLPNRPQRFMDQRWGLWGLKGNLFGCAYSLGLLWGSLWNLLEFLGALRISKWSITNPASVEGHSTTHPVTQLIMVAMSRVFNEQKIPFPGNPHNWSKRSMK